jgi:hypothetical protein
LGQTIVRVDINSTATTPDGTTWPTAFKYLQDGLTFAMSNLPAEVWVADGTYFPDVTAGSAPNGSNARTATFAMANDLELLGGFAGGATNETDKNQRNPLVNITILSGDLQQNDNPSSSTTFDDNAYHVVTAELVDPSGVIDGFTIKAGNAQGSEVPVPQCSGLTCPEESECSYGLTSGRVGGGMILLGVQTADNCGACWPLVLRCRFEGNQAESGGAVFHSANQLSNPLFANCQFVNNTATSGPGGAMQLNSDVQFCTATLINCLFTGNMGTTGGALAVGTYAGATLINCTIVDNSASATSGGAGAITHSGPCPIGFREGSISIRNCIVFDNETPQLVGPVLAIIPVSRT